VIFTIIKNIARESFFGTLSVRSHAPKTHKYSSNIIREIGGAAFLMERASIIGQMVTKFLNHLGDIYIGDFKNGLKHGSGI
jgi:hypothetical protein